MRIARGLHAYMYVVNNPISYVDPDGLIARHFKKCPLKYLGIYNSKDYCLDTTWNQFHEPKLCFRELNSFFQGINGVMQICYDLQGGGCDIEFDKVCPCTYRDSETRECKGCYVPQTILHIAVDVIPGLCCQGNSQ